MVREICVLTGTRAEYSLLKPILNEIVDHKELELKLIVTGMHLRKDFGGTIDEIKIDGFTINSKVDINVEGDEKIDMAKSTSLGIEGFTKALQRIKPDIVFLLGDRIETIACAFACVILNIPIAHMGGGQNSGCIDNSIRHAVTTMSHIHFTTDTIRADRLKEMGEDPNRIHTVGELFSGNIRKVKDIKIKDIEDKFSLDSSNPILLVLFHPDTLNIKQSLNFMENILNAIEEIREQTIIIYPNSDAGGKKIINLIETFKEDKSFVKTYKNLPQIDFFSLMKISTVMIGNSSAGFNEAFYFNLPVINIGDRQKFRDRKPNIVDIDGSKGEIKHEIEKVISKKESYINDEYLEKFLDENKDTGKRIAEILSRLELSEELLHKTYADEITYD